MNMATITLSPTAATDDAARRALGIAVGPLAASIGARYTVFALWHRPRPAIA